MGQSAMTESGSLNRGNVIKLERIRKDALRDVERTMENLRRYFNTIGIAEQMHEEEQRIGSYIGSLATIENQASRARRAFEALLILHYADEQLVEKPDIDPIDNDKEVYIERNENGYPILRGAQGSEPSCPRCKNRNAMLFIERDKDRGFAEVRECRDCRFKVWDAEIRVG